MAKELFNWKGLFINDGPSDQKEQQTTPPPPPPAQRAQQQETPVNRFPDEQPKQYTGNDATNPFLTDVIGVYEKGFESLNASGFDFFELYKSVMAVGATNPQSYQMAFTMGKTINPALTKEFLQEKAKFYIAEIEKVHAKYDADGKAKQISIDNSITAEKFNLSKTVEELEAKIIQLQNELEAKKAELLKIDSGSREKYSEIQLKIAANNLAKNRILESINTVLTGINQYL
jgi:uncharacterized small protein (DUF1192 family)